MKIAIAGLFLGLFAGGLRAAAPVDCGSCHDQGKKLTASAHASLSCDTCHEGYNAKTHPAGITKPACATCHDDVAAEYAKGVHGAARKAGNESAPDCGMCHGGAHEIIRPSTPAFRTGLPDTCGMCHSDIAEQYKASVHGQALARGVREVPACSDCHSAHNIARPESANSPVNSANIRETCASCHANVRLTRKFGLPSDRVVSYDLSFHGLAGKAGMQTIANCASCHGVHNILPSSDPKSTINPIHLPQTCGKCHPGAGTRFTISKIHVVQGAVSEPTVLRFVRQFYFLVIPVTIGLMLIHNLGDWLRKLLNLRFRPHRVRGALRTTLTGIRMLPFERLQHAVMAISFIVLVWTGFALKYPDQWWARPLLMLEGRTSLRSIVHRIAAGVFMAVAITHFVSLIVNRRLRKHWLEMLPTMNDPREAMSNFAYNLGLGDKKPSRSSHSYVEKAEYWAVVWGAVVMVATGLMLWANNLALRFLPKLWLDVATSIHFYEAILASLAIVVWHFYSVIFDPDVYPLNTAFLTGYTEKKEEHHEKHRKEEEVPGD